MRQKIIYVVYYCLSDAIEISDNLIGILVNKSVSIFFLILPVEVLGKLLYIRISVGRRSGGEFVFKYLYQENEVIMCLVQIKITVFVTIKILVLTSISCDQ